MQTIIVILIVGAALYFVGRRFFNTLGRGASSDCGCSCSGCGEQNSKPDRDNE